jgi:chitinase
MLCALPLEFPHARRQLWTAPDSWPALDCLTKKVSCGSYQTHGTWPSLRGLMTWSINWDRFNQWEFSKNFDAYGWS